MLDEPEDTSSSTNDQKFDKTSSKSGSKGPSSKSKDLSHVPCKFFRVGSCTAGSSCPFSHSAAAPGQQKEACAWFVKGNCKFGHKCALAHVLPGQSTAMDRRNKKAAQLAATSAGGGSAQKDRDRDRDRDRDSRGRKSVSTTTTTGQASGRGTPSRSNTLLSGSTAPTRMLPTGARPPLPLSISKAAPAPAETAPSLQDADFTSYDTIAKSGGQAEMDAHEDEASNVDSPTNGVSSPPAKSASPFPGSTPSKPHRFTGRHGSSPSVDFGPVGSPPRASPSTNASANANPIRINGFSPGTSPRDPAYATQHLAAGQTFSAPGTNLFMHPSSPRGSGLAASLSLSGTQPLSNAQSFAVGSLPILSRALADSQAYSEALDDEDMEEFVPSSLKDLLTPEEQNRRMSRTSSSQTGAGIVGGGGGIPTSLARSGVQRDESRHRHSHSVPSASLLSQDLRSIWADAGGELGQMDNNMGFGISPSASGAGILGTSPSFASSSGLHPFDNEGPSPSMLNPSNASAAFLGLHHYMAHSRMPGGGIGATRAVSQGNIHHQAGLTSTGAPLTPSIPSSFDALNTRAHGLSSSPSHLSRAPFDAFSSSPSKHGYRPVPAAASAAFRAPDQSHALSPGSRALQAHAPGQSLPQGLAAGASRIHLQPPTAFSPGSHGTDLGIGASVSPANSGLDWMSATPTKQQHFEQPAAAAVAATSPPANGGSGVSTPASDQSVPASMNKEADVGGLTSAFSHLSYSSVAASGLRGHHPHPHGSAAAAVPTSMSRRSSARGWSAHPLSSPLSGPVLTNDDDDLFSMDEEK